MERGHRLAELRGSRTQKQIADLLGVKPQAVSNWERGVADVDRRHLAALDLALDAGGEVIDLYTSAATGVTLADVMARLDVLRDGQLEVRAASSTSIAEATTKVTEAIERLAREVEGLRRRVDRSAPAVRTRR